MSGRFGDFGKAMQDYLGPKVERLGKLGEEGNEEGFAALLEEMAKGVDGLFTEACKEFTKALGGYLAYHGQNDMSICGETLSGATCAMAINGARLQHEIFERALRSAEQHLAEVQRETQEEESGLMALILKEIGDPANWDVTIGEHSLSDLFPPKRDMDA